MCQVMYCTVCYLRMLRCLPDGLSIHGNGGVYEGGELKVCPWHILESGIQIYVFILGNEYVCAGTKTCSVQDDCTRFEEQWSPTDMLSSCASGAAPS